VDAPEASTLVGLGVGVGGLHYPGGLWLHPPDLCRTLLEADGIEVRYGVSVARLERRDDRWRALDGDGRELAAAPVVVVAAGHEAGRFEQTAGLPLRPVRGQVSHLPATANSERMGAALSYEGYLTPALRGVHCLGATFGPGDPEPAVREQEHRENLAELAEWLPGLASGYRAEELEGRVSFRCASPDRLPQLGPVPDLAAYSRDYGDLRYGRHWKEYPPAAYHEGLYLCAGHGARGLSSAPLAGEALAAMIAGEPLPVEDDLVRALHPARYRVRELKRQ
jgi:tRNA 5-methylaminomethyl-2-thiouridine biosynthesis bifunctional protein